MGRRSRPRSAPSTAFGGPPSPASQGRMKAQAAATSYPPLRSKRIGRRPAATSKILPRSRGEGDHAQRWWRGAPSRASAGDHRRWWRGRTPFLMRGPCPQGAPYPAILEKSATCPVARAVMRASSARRLARHRLVFVIDEHILEEAIDRFPQRREREPSRRKNPAPRSPEQPLSRPSLTASNSFVSAASLNRAGSTGVGDRRALFLLGSQDVGRPLGAGQKVAAFVGVEKDPQRSHPAGDQKQVVVGRPPLPCGEGGPEGPVGEASAADEAEPPPSVRCADTSPARAGRRALRPAG